MKIQEVNSDTDIELLHIIDTSDIKDTENPEKVTVCKDERKYYTKIRCQNYFGYQRRWSKENIIIK